MCDDCELDGVVVLTRTFIRAAMRHRVAPGRYIDTLDIARVVEVDEADVWNALARTDDGLTRASVVLRKSAREVA